MTLAKRVVLFLAMNFAILLVLMIILSIVSAVFWVNLTWYWYNLGEVLIVAAIIWFAWAFISLGLSKTIVKWIHKPEIITAENKHKFWEKERFVYQVVHEISNSNKIRMPEVWVYESSEPNAFATWPTKNRSLVAVSTWLLQQMNEDEIEGVVGHEMSHVLNGDMVTMTLLQGVLNTFVIFISRIIWTTVDKFVFDNEDGPGIGYFVVSIIAQLVLSVLATIVLAAYSRHREFKADKWSADLVWRDKMIAWLQKLQYMVERKWVDDTPATNSMKIAAPGAISKLFSTHPPIEERINNLKSLN